MLYLALKCVSTYAALYITSKAPNNKLRHNKFLTLRDLKNKMLYQIFEILYTNCFQLILILLFSNIFLQICWTVRSSKLKTQNSMKLLMPSFQEELKYKLRHYSVIDTFYQQMSIAESTHVAVQIGHIQNN